MDKALGPVSLIGLILLGIALLWVVRLVYGLRRGSSDDSLRLVLNIASWVMIIVGLIGATVQLLLGLSVVAVPIIVGVLVMAVTRYRSLERRSLLWTLSIAAQKGIPLDEAAMGFARERPGELGIRAQRLAELLRSGLPLPEALRRSRTRLPNDALLAVRLGTESGNLGAAMGQIAQQDDDLDFLVRSMFEKYFYLGLVFLVITLQLTFMMLSIVPVFAKMFSEFDLELPATTQLVIGGSNWFVSYWFLFLGPLLPVLFAVLILGVLYYVDLLPRDLPLVNRLSRRIDAAHLMRALALAVELQWPLDRTIWTLARVYPKQGIRWRLQTAGEQIASGEDWCDALHRARLITQTDAAVLAAAQRAGNLQWALQEMADSSVRRLTYWMRFWLNVLFPVVLLAMGVLITIVVVGLFIPLIALIQGLA